MNELIELGYVMEETKASPRHGVEDFDSSTGG